MTSVFESLLLFLKSNDINEDSYIELFTKHCNYLSKQYENDKHSLKLTKVREFKLDTSDPISYTLDTFTDIDKMLEIENKIKSRFRKLPTSLTLYKNIIVSIFNYKGIYKVPDSFMNLILERFSDIVHIDNVFVLHSNSNVNTFFNTVKNVCKHDLSFLETSPDNNKKIILKYNNILK